MASSIEHNIDGEYIREWLMLGPFFPDDLDIDFLADAGGEANVQPKEGDTVTTTDGRTLTWERYSSRKNTVDLVDAIGNHQYATAYAYCILQSETEGDGEIRLGSASGAAAWMNGERVYCSTDSDLFMLDEDMLEVNVKAGTNRCMIKVFDQSRPEWYFAARVLPVSRAVVSGTITDEKGEPIPGVHVRLDQDGEKVIQTVTDTSGHYWMGIYPACGSYDLSATYEELGSLRLGIHLDEKERLTLDLTLKDAVSIEGTILMLDDTTPHIAVPVQAICDGRVAATTLTDEQGKYRFVNLKPGEYELRCHVPKGYVYYERGGDKEVLQVNYNSAFRSIDFRFAPFKKGIWKHYRPFDGLAHDTVNCIYAASDGTMWFGTDGGGVSCYDGREFTNFTTEDGLAGGAVWIIYGDGDGVMWFGTWGYGVSRYDGKEFVNFTTRDGLANDRIMSICRDLNSILWFGTWGSGVSRYDGRGFVNFTTRDGLAHNMVDKIYCDPDGILWFGTHCGLSRYDGKEFTNFTTEDGLPYGRVGTIYRDPDGVMWFGEGYSGGKTGGIIRYSGREFSNLMTKDRLELEYGRVMSIQRAPDGVMWFGMWGRGVSYYDEVGFVNFTTRDGLPSNIVKDLHIDPDGMIWIASGSLLDFHPERGGVSCYDSKTFVNFTTRDGLPDNAVKAIHIDRDGVMWIGTLNGVSRYDGVEFVNFSTEDGLTHDNVFAIHSDSRGILWFGTGAFGVTGRGVSRYDGTEFRSFTTRDGLPSNIVNAIHCDPDGVTWIGTQDGGISRYDGKEFVNFTTEDGLANNLVNAIYRDPDGVLWFATGRWEGKGGVSRYDTRSMGDSPRFVNFSTDDGLVNNGVRSIQCDHDGILWIGTWSGVSCYDGSEFVNFTVKNGLAGNLIHSIYCDSHGVLWFGTDSMGVSGYDGIAWTSLDTRDGLAGNQVTSIQQDSDGFLWFGTNLGLTRYRRSTIPPKAHIVSVTTDQTYTDLSTIPPFTPGTRVTIEYGSIDFRTLPEKRQYRCRIQAFGKSLSKEEMDSDRHKPTNSIFFDHIFDQPGKYTFQVQAIDRDLNYSEPKSVELEVIPDPRNHQIAQLKGELAERERAELERVYQELEDARQIQQSLLPDKPPEVKGFEIAGTSRPAREVSGDFYSYLSLGDNTGIVLADVTGKSVKAAMVAALTNGTLNAEIRDRADVWNSPGSILRQLNIDLQPHLIRGMYTAMSLGIIQPEKKKLIFSNAGMPYPVVKHGREVWELEVSGMPLGLVDKVEYEDLSVDLEPGDFVIFCSDGVIEATDEAGEMYQTERLLELIQQADTDISAHEMVDLIVKDVTAFVGDVEPSDDMTVVVLKCDEVK